MPPLPDALRTPPPALAPLLAAWTRACAGPANAALPPEALARLLAAPLAGGACFARPDTGLRTLLQRRIESLHGEFRTLAGPFRLVELGEDPGVARITQDDVWLGRALIVNAPARAARGDPARLRAARCRAGSTAPRRSRARVRVHARALREAVPEPLARRSVLAGAASGCGSADWPITLLQEPSTRGPQFVELVAGATFPADHDVGAAEDAIAAGPRRSAALRGQPGAPRERRAPPALGRRQRALRRAARELAARPRAARLASHRVSARARARRGARRRGRDPARGARRRRDPGGSFLISARPRESSYVRSRRDRARAGQPAGLLAARRATRAPISACSRSRSRLSAVYAGSRTARAWLIEPVLDEVDLAAPAERRAAVARRSLTSRACSSPARAAPEAAPASADARARRRLRAKVLAALPRILLGALLIVLVLPLAHVGQEVLSQWVLGRVLVDLQQQLCEKLLSLPLRLPPRPVARRDALARDERRAEGAPEPRPALPGRRAIRDRAARRRGGRSSSSRGSSRSRVLLIAPLVAGVIAAFGAAHPPLRQAAPGEPERRHAAAAPDPVGHQGHPELPRAARRGARPSRARTCATSAATCGCSATAPTRARRSRASTT